MVSNAGLRVSTRRSSKELAKSATRKRFVGHKIMLIKTVTRTVILSANADHLGIALEVSSESLRDMRNYFNIFGT